MSSVHLMIETFFKIISLSLYLYLCMYLSISVSLYIYRYLCKYLSISVCSYLSLIKSFFCNIFQSVLVTVKFRRFWMLILETTNVLFFCVNDLSVCDHAYKGIRNAHNKHHIYLCETRSGFERTFCHPQF